MRLKKRVAKLEKDLELALHQVTEQQNQINGQETIIKKQQIEIENLKNELAKYKNSNTPSSANKHLQSSKQSNQVEKETNGKRGAPFGHKGATRKRVPTRKQEIDCDTCPKCKGHNLKTIQRLKRVTEDIKKNENSKEDDIFDDNKIEMETTESAINKKKCLDCKHEFVPPKNTVPLKGTAGINLLVMVVFIRFLLRGVYRKTTSFMEAMLTTSWTPASINAMINRVADAADEEYEKILKRIRNSMQIYVDETSFSVLGLLEWVWVFRTSTDILIVIRASRGNDVLKEILGENYKGNINCDGWRAYDFFPLATIQRCWAHLERKAKELTDTVIGKHFYEKLMEMFHEIKEFNKDNPTQKLRNAKYEELTARMIALRDYYSKYTELASVIKYIDNHIEQWFTCVKIPGVEPTNNFAEQSIRETVMVRKIIGAFRSQLGKKSYERLASLFATWQIRSLDLKKELKKMLIRNLCH